MLCVCAAYVCMLMCVWRMFGVVCFVYGCVVCQSVYTCGVFMMCVVCVGVCLVCAFVVMMCVDVWGGGILTVTDLRWSGRSYQLSPAKGHVRLLLCSVRLPYQIIY